MGGGITGYHEELIARLCADIEAREHWQAAWAVPGTDESERAALTEVREVSRANAAWLSEQLQVAGWPLESVAGIEAAEAAWAIAQHTDHDPAFQAHCLELMRAAVAAGEAPAARLAYLEDRVRVALGRPQLYGTQEIQLPGMDWELLPVEDPARLNERRAAVGLPALDIAQIRNLWLPPLPGADTK